MIQNCDPLKIYCKCGKLHFIEGNSKDFLEVVNCKCGRDINDKCRDVLKDLNEFKEIMNELYNFLEVNGILNKLWDLYMKLIVGSIEDVD